MKSYSKSTQSKKVFDSFKILTITTSLIIGLIYFHISEVNATPLGGLAKTVCTEIFGSGCAYAGGSSCGSVTGEITGGIRAGVFEIGAGGKVTINCTTDPSAVQVN